MGQAPAIGPDPSVLDRPARCPSPSALADRAGPDARSAAFRERDPVRAQGASRAAAERALDPLGDGSRPLVGYGQADPRPLAAQADRQGALIGARYRAR